MKLGDRARERFLAMQYYTLSAAQQAVLESLPIGWTVHEPEVYDDWGVCDAKGNWWPQTTAWNGRIGTDSESGEVYFYHAKS